MNILLLSMPDVAPGYPPAFLAAPSLGLASIAGNADGGHRLSIADLVLKREDVKSAVREALETTRPDLVGLSALSFQYSSAVKVAKFVKSWNADTRVALGGYHATLMAHEIAQSPESPFFDFLFRGESDLSFNEAVRRLESGRDLAGLDGVSYQKNGTFVHNPRRPPEDLSRIKLPARHRNLWTGYHALRAPFDLIEYSRGCLGSCNFCCIREMYGRSFRAFDIPRVIADLDALKKRGTQIVFFTDDNITTDIPRFERFCEAIVRHGHQDLHYAVQASPRSISSSKSLVEKMARAGFKMVFLGLENASRENLAYLKKGDVVGSTIRAVRYLKDHDILVALGLMVGLPEDDRKSIERTIRFARDLKADFASVQLLVPYPRTELRRDLSARRLVVNPDDYSLYGGNWAAVRTNYLTAEELSFIRYRYEKRYFKSKIFTIVRAFRKDLKIGRKFVRGGLKLLPDVGRFFFHEFLKRMFLSERQIFQKYTLEERALNKFNL